LSRLFQYSRWARYVLVPIRNRSAIFTFSESPLALCSNCPGFHPVVSVPRSRSAPPWPGPFPAAPLRNVPLPSSIPWPRSIPCETPLRPGTTPACSDVDFGRREPPRGAGGSLLCYDLFTHVNTPLIIGVSTILLLNCSLKNAISHRSRRREEADSFIGNSATARPPRYRGGYFSNELLNQSHDLVVRTDPNVIPFAKLARVLILFYPVPEPLPIPRLWEETCFLNVEVENPREISRAFRRLDFPVARPSAGEVGSGSNSGSELTGFKTPLRRGEPKGPVGGGLTPVLTACG